MLSGKWKSLFFLTGEICTKVAHLHLSSFQDLYYHCHISHVFSTAVWWDTCNDISILYFTALVLHEGNPGYTNLLSTFALHFAVVSLSEPPTFIAVLAMFVWVWTDVAGYSFETFKALAVAIPIYAIAALERNKMQETETQQTNGKPRYWYLSKALLTVAVKNRTLESNGSNTRSHLVRAAFKSHNRIHIRAEKLKPTDEYVPSSLDVLWPMLWAQAWSTNPELHLSRTTVTIKKKYPTLPFQKK